MNINSTFLEDFGSQYWRRQSGVLPKGHNATHFPMNQAGPLLLISIMSFVEISCLMRENLQEKNLKALRAFKIIKIRSLIS